MHPGDNFAGRFAGPARLVLMRARTDDPSPGRPAAQRCSGDRPEPFEILFDVQASEPPGRPTSAPGGAARRLVRLVLPTATTFGQLIPTLEAALALPPDPHRRWYAEHEEVRDCLPVGHPPLLAGVTLSTHPQPAPQRGPIRLSVTSGPDAGRTFDLGYGSHEIGRSRTCSVRIADPHLSRRHARLWLDPDGAHWSDVGSTNGTEPTELDGQLPAPRGAGWPAMRGVVTPPTATAALAGGPDSDRVGQAGLRIGHRRDPQIRLAATTTLRLGIASRAAGPDAPTLSATGRATLRLTPQRYPRTPVADRLIAMPRPEQPRPAPSLSTLAVALPVVVSGLMAVVLRMWMILAFGAMSTVLTLAHHLGERRRHRRDQRAEAERFDAELASCREQIADAIRQEREHLERELPDLAAVASTVVGRTPELWCRPLPGLIVRLGLGDRPAQLRIQHQSGRPIETTAPGGESGWAVTSTTTAGLAMGSAGPPYSDTNRTSTNRTSTNRTSTNDTGGADDPEAVATRRARGRRGTSQHPWPSPSTGPGQISHPLLTDVPIGLDLTEGPVGVVGAPPELGAGLARSLITQVLAGWSPSQVVVWLIVDNLDRLTHWGWLLWAPQLRPAEPGARWRVAVVADGAWLPGLDLAPLLDELARRRQSPRSSDGGAGLRHAGLAGSPSQAPQILVVLDRASALAHDPGLGEVLQADPSLGVHLLCLGDPDHPTPTQCVSSVILRDGRADLLRQGQRQSFRPDALAADTARAIARRLAPLRDDVPTTGAAGLPTTVGGHVVSPVPLDSETLAAELARRWRRLSQPVLRVPLGRDQAGVFELDLGKDGPHALIAGTTGAGKSELLRTLIAALAVANHPGAVRFVLIDYKGGSAFDDCARLPHTAGLVTDLDDRLADRALRALAAELRRREELLRQAGVGSVDDLPAPGIDDRSATGEAGPRRQLPNGLFRLVIIIDEYRVLAEHLPGFIDGLVRIAAQGRSLGVHLVLATQRPAGIVTADIRANVNLRIALRVRDEADSHDVVGCADAAFVPRDTPGRAVLRCGSDPIRVVQTAWVGGCSTRPVAPTPQLTWVEAATGGGLAATRHDAAADAASPAHLPTDLNLIAAAAREAAHAVSFTPPPPPWPPPLPEVIPAWQLNPGRLSAGPTTTGCAIGPAQDTLSLALGLLDEPDRQRHTPWRWRPWRDGPLGIAGTAGTGRTSAVWTVACLAALSTCPAHLNLCIIDGAGALGQLRALPHTTCYADPLDPAFLRRVITALAQRVTTGPNPSTGSSSPYPRGERSRLLVVIDGWEQLQAAIDRPQPGSRWDELISVIRLGGSAGVAVVVTGDRALLLPPLAPLLGERVALRLADPNDYLVAGLPGLPRTAAAGRTGQGTNTPGRGRHLGHAAELQLATVTPRPEPLDTQRAQLVRDVRERHAHCPGPGWLMQPLPRHCHLAELPVSAPPVRPPEAGGLRVTFGVTADDLQAASLDVCAPGALILGPAGSGRSNALAVIGQLLAAQGRPCALVTRGLAPSGLGRSIDPGHLGAAQEIAALAAPTVVLVDDLDGLLGTGTEEALLARANQPDGGAVIGAGTGRGVAGRYHGLVGVLRRSGYALALNPGRAEEEALGVRLPTDDPLLPGRGVLVKPRGVTVVQIAVADP